MEYISAKRSYQSYNQEMLFNLARGYAGHLGSPGYPRINRQSCDRAMRKAFRFVKRD